MAALSEDEREMDPAPCNGIQDVESTCEYKSPEETHESEHSNECDVANENPNDVISFIPKLGPRRWLVLASYCLLTISNLESWYAFSSISNIVQKYYEINLIQVNLLAMVFSITSILLMFPSYRLLEKNGLKQIMVMAGFFNAVGCCIRYTGYWEPNFGYHFLLIGSILCAVSTSAFLFLPSKIAAVWFGENERAKAISIGISADSLGMALSYILPTYLVPNSLESQEIGIGLGNFLLVSALQAFSAFVFICIFVKDRPLTPPSYSELLKLKAICNDVSLELSNSFTEENLDEETSQSAKATRLIAGIDGYKMLLKNINFHTVLNIHGVLFGIESIFLIALNEILAAEFPGYEREIGWMGSIGLIIGIPTNFLVGVILDKTHSFKRVTLATTGLTCLLTALLTLLFSFKCPFYTLFFTYLAVVAIFSTYYTTAFDHCAELTYPVSEGQSGVILLWVAQFYSVLFDQSASLILYYIGPKELLFCILGLYIIIFLLSFLVKERGSRPSAKEANTETCMK